MALFSALNFAIGNAEIASTQTIIPRRMIYSLCSEYNIASAMLWLKTNKQIKNRLFKADEALKWGLVNYVVEQDQLIEKANEIAGKILNNSGSAISSAIRAINANFQDGMNGYEVEIEEFGKCFGTADFKEGTTAFLEKRKPSFRS